MPQLSTNRVLPKALTQLRLCSSLNGCGATRVKDAFDKSGDPSLYVYDDKSIGYSDWVNSVPVNPSKCLHVKNSSNITVCLLPLDGRIITGPSYIIGGICDCMLLSEKKMSLVEFKTNVTSTNPQTTLDKANDAIQQLWHTFDSIIYPKCLKSKAVKLSIDFHVVFDEDYKVTGVNSTIMDLGTDFLLEKKYPLYFDNEIEFV